MHKSPSLFLSENCSTYFGFHYHPSSGAQNNCNYSIWYPQHIHISSNSSTIAADNSTGTYIIHYSIELTDFSAEYTFLILI